MPRATPLVVLALTALLLLVPRRPEAAEARPTVPEVDWVEILAVVDNTYDCFQKDTACALRLNTGRVDGFDDLRVQSEMGLAYVVRAGVGGVVHTLLYDFGLTPEVYANNLGRLGVDVAGAEALVLSHGHEDHYAALPWAVARTRAPVVVGGAGAFAHRMFVGPTHRWDMGELRRATVDPGGDRVVEAPEPRVLAGFALSTGVIPLETAFERIPPFLQLQTPAGLVSDSLDHELALAFRVRGQGLVVLTACAHRGVVNSVRRAMALTGESRLHAVVGGMHLTSAPVEQVTATVEAFRALAPTWIAPLHCTGEEALHQLRAAFPAAYVHPSTGTRYRFGPVP